jgi:hypothetical protein
MGDGLSTLIEKCKKIGDEAHFDAFVLESETYLRSQNKEWSLERLKK